MKTCQPGAWPRRLPALTLALAVLVCSDARAQADDTWVLADAERFAVLLQQPGLPDAQALQTHYLDPATAGVRLFTPHRIRSAATLAAAVAANPDTYRRAAQLCLPAARRMAAEAARIAARIGTLLGATRATPAYVVFGAGNSGGTASEAGLVLGLEVICQQAEDGPAAEQLIRDFVAHELVHVHQERAGTAQSSTDLLRQSLVEGFADYVMAQVSGGKAGAGLERERYGRAHEARLWREFRGAVAAGQGLAGWLCSPAVEAGRPADMGYWIGQRICEAYLARAADPALALKTLLHLRDPQAIWQASGLAGAH